MIMFLHFAALCKLKPFDRPRLILFLSFRRAVLTREDAEKCRRSNGRSKKLESKMKQRRNKSGDYKKERG
jgi:hypothetical protein